MGGSGMGATNPLDVVSAESQTLPGELALKMDGIYSISKYTDFCINPRQCQMGLNPSTSGP